MKVVRFSWTRVPTRVLYHRKLYQQNSAHDYLYSGLEWKFLVQLFLIYCQTFTFIQVGYKAFLHPHLTRHAIFLFLLNSSINLNSHVCHQIQSTHHKKYNHAKHLYDQYKYLLLPRIDRSISATTGAIITCFNPSSSVS